MNPLRRLRLKLDPTDSRIVKRVESVLYSPATYAWWSSLSPAQTFSLRYVPVLEKNTLAYLLLFAWFYLVTVYGARRASGAAKVFFEKSAWANLILLPAAVLYEIAFVEVASYNLYLWNNFGPWFWLGAFTVLGLFL